MQAERVSDGCNHKHECWVRRVLSAQVCMYVCRHTYTPFLAQCFPSMLLKKRSRFTTLTLPVPEQESDGQPDHDAACGRVPGPHVASSAVSSGMWLMVVLYVSMGRSMCVL